MKLHKYAISYGYNIKYKKCKKDEVSLIFFITCCISKFMKLFWINLLTVKCLIDQIHSFEIEEENIRLAELN